MSAYGTASGTYFETKSCSSVFEFKRLCSPTATIANCKLETCELSWHFACSFPRAAHFFAHLFH